MSYTTIEQSKHLLELGLNPETADCVWEQHNGLEPYVTVKPHTTLGKSIGAHAVPCWSVTALLELMPTPTLSRIDDEKKNDPSLWYCDSIQFGEDYFHHQGGYHDNPICACIEAIEWLIQNGHIRKEER